MRSTNMRPSPALVLPRCGLAGCYRVLPCPYRHQDDRRGRAARVAAAITLPITSLSSVMGMNVIVNNSMRWIPDLVFDHAGHFVGLASLDPQTGLVVSIRPHWKWCERDDHVCTASCWLSRSGPGSPSTTPSRSPPTRSRRTAGQAAVETHTPRAGDTEADAVINGVCTGRGRPGRGHPEETRHQLRLESLRCSNGYFRSTVGARPVNELAGVAPE
jgi:hypothetical protein